MSTKNNTPREEEKRCGACDCYDTEDGCECRRVPCSRCGNNDNLFNMNHDEFHNEYWFNGMSFNTKLNEVLCDSCYNCSSEDEEEEADY